MGNGDLNVLANRLAMHEKAMIDLTKKYADLKIALDSKKDKKTAEQELTAKAAQWEKQLADARAADAKITGDLNALAQKLAAEAKLDARFVALESLVHIHQSKLTAAQTEVAKLRAEVDALKKAK